MHSLKKAFETGFGNLGVFCFKHPWSCLILGLTVCLGLASQMSHLQMDTRNETFFHKDDKVLLDYNTFRDQYGKDEFIIVAIDNPEIFSFEFLEKLRSFHKELEENLPYLDKITSLVNVRNTYGEGDELRVEDFLEKWPQTPEDLNELEQQARSNSFYQNLIISEDGKTTAVIIKPYACNPDSNELLQIEGSCEPMSNEQNRELMATLEEITGRYDAETFSLALSGMPVVVDYLNLLIEKDLSSVIPAVYLVVILTLGIVFRRVTAVVYPVMIFVVSLVCAFAVMAILRIPITNITIILPSFMLVVSISDAVHILALFYPEYEKCGDKVKAIQAAMAHSGLAVLMTSVTTAIGLVSFATAEVAPVGDLGLVAPIGVCLAFFYTVILLPALLSIFPVKRKAVTERNDKMALVYKNLAGFSCKHRRIVLAGFLILVAIAATGIPKLKFSHLALRWFPEGSQIRLDTEAIDKKLRGSVSLDVIIDTGKPDGLYDPDFIIALEEAVNRYIGYRYQDIFIGKIMDMTTILKETNRALHNNDSSHYKIPEKKSLIAQELFLFQLSGSDDLDELVDEQFSQTRLALHLPYKDSAKFKHLVEQIGSDLKQTFPQAQISVTGVNALFIEMLNNVMVTMMRSYSFALATISILMVFMLGRLRMGILSMIPNILPIFIVMGVMGWCNIALDFGTILIGSIAIGIIVDDTIHFLHNFSKYYQQTGSAEAATFKSLTTVGRAMLATSVVLSGGFLCNLLSGLTINQYIGFLLATTIVVALITDFLLMPAILALVYERKKELVVTGEVAS